VSVTRRYVIAAPSGYRNREAASFMAQMDDQSQRLLRNLEGIGAAELEWQPSPGMNTIGMLLAHIAIVEVFWTQIGVRAGAPDFESVLGIGGDDDGMPIPEGGLPPAVLAGRKPDFYLDLLDRARAYARQVAMEVSDTDLDTMRSRTRRDGEQEEFNVRWVLYHMLEHLAGHYGQILLLRHQYKVAGTRSGATS